MIDLIVIVVAAIHVASGATVGAALLRLPRQARGWAIATVSFYALYWVLMLIDGIV